MFRLLKDPHVLEMGPCLKKCMALVVFLRNIGRRTQYRWHHNVPFRSRFCWPFLGVESHQIGNCNDYVDVGQWQLIMALARNLTHGRHAEYNIQVDMKDVSLAELRA